MIIKAGGQCAVCGYKKNLAALAFHHLHEKGSKLNGSNLIKMSVSGAEEEMKRCVLVCHNCHSEIHNPELTLKRMLRMWKLIYENKFTHEQAYKECFDN
jgi:5-methylcytosine-specific restriction endonuclease McrA